MSQKSILVVDDDRDFLILITKCLQNSGYKVQCAQDPLQATAISQREMPDLILLDIMMPAGGGLAALQRLRMSAKTSSIPIVVVTGNQDPKMEERIRVAGAFQILHKPCDEATLLGRIHEVLGQGN